jgi:integrase
MSLPQVETIRKRILKVPQQNVKVCLMCAYLFGCRISELVSVKSPRDNTVARGPRGTDLRIASYQLCPNCGREIHYYKPTILSKCPFCKKVLETGEEIAIFMLKTAKRKGKIRYVALPTNPEYEPWTQYVVHHYENRNKKPCFPFTRQKVGFYARQTFKGLKYPIESYTWSPLKGKKKTVSAHPRSFNVHALRHLRTTELVDVYGFDGFEISTWGGWKLSTTTGVSGSVGRYTHRQWWKYIPKLLRPRP